MIILEIHFMHLKVRGNEGKNTNNKKKTLNQRFNYQRKDHYIAINVSKVQTVNTVKTGWVEQGFVFFFFCITTEKQPT